MNDKQDTSDQYPSFIRIRSESGCESVHYSFLYEGLPDEFRMKAEKEMNETEEKRKIGIQRLKNLTKKEQLDPLDDHLLIAVLRSCKFDLKKSEDKLRSFLSHRRMVIQKMAKLDPALVERILGDMSTGILPYRDSLGRFILFTQPDCMHLEDYSVGEGATVILALLLFALSFEMTTVSGMVYYGECKSQSIYKLITVCNMIRQFAPTVIAFPIRIANIEVFNEIAFIRWFIRIIRQILPEKVGKRITLNGSEYDNLHKQYPPDMLPEEFGGNMGPMKVNAFKDKFLDFITELVTEAKSADSNEEHQCSL